MDSNHNSFSVLGQLSPNQTSNPNTLSLLDKINTTKNTSSASVIKPKPLHSSKQSAFAHYYASTSSSVPKKYSFNHFPKLASRSGIARHSFLKTTVQGGSLVQFYENSDLFKLFQIAKLEPFVFYRIKVVCPSLVQEFYCNLVVNYGMNGEKFATSVLDGKPILITHEILSKAIGLNYKISKQPLLDVSQAFIFDKNEFHLYISTFCKCDVPVGMFDSDEAIPYVHFAPEFQVLALIFRANIFPKPNLEKSFNFLDLKIMFLLLTDKLNFNLAYMVLLNLLDATQLSYMPYGMLLNSLFMYLKFDVNCYPSQKFSACILEKSVRSQVPLSDFVPMSISGVNAIKCMAEHTLLVGKVDEFHREMSTEIEGMKNLYMKALQKVNHLTNVVFSLEHKVELLEHLCDNQVGVLKKLKVDRFVPCGGTECESVCGKNVGDAMEEGEVAANM